MIILAPNIHFHDDVFFRASARFVEAFQAMWSRMREAARNVLLAFFETKPCHVHLCFKMDLDVRRDEPWGRCAPATDKVFLTFLVPFMERADNDEGVIGVIAHELAHCHNHATGKYVADEDAEEKQVSELLASWGFDDSIGYSDEWKAAVEMWRACRELSFGQHTEKQLFGVA